MKYLTIIGMVLALTLGIFALAFNSTAQAATNLGYSASNPPAKPGVDYCSGDTPKECGLNQDMLRKIKGVPNNGRIDIILYSVSWRPLADALIDRAKAGVKIRVITARQKPGGDGDGVEPDGEMKRLLDNLKKYDNAKVKVCWGACARSGKAGIEHEKVVALSSTQGTSWVVVSDSGNWTYQTDLSENDRITWADKKSYDGVLKHIDLLWKDKTIKYEAPVVSSDKKHTIYWMPSSKTDPVTNWARKAKAKKGCYVGSSYFYLTGSKDDYIKGLIRLRKAGCTVEVIANNNLTGHWSDTQKKNLIKGGVKVISISKYVEKDGCRKIYSHRKMTVATGLSGGATRLFQGSTTMNSTAYTKNGNQVVESTVSSEGWDAKHDFERMAAKGTVLTLKNYDDKIKTRKGC